MDGALLPASPVAATMAPTPEPMPVRARTVESPAARPSLCAQLEETPMLMRTPAQQQQQQQQRSQKPPSQPQKPLQRLRSAEKPNNQRLSRRQEPIARHRPTAPQRHPARSLRGTPPQQQEQQQQEQRQQQLQQRTPPPPPHATTVASRRAAARLALVSPSVAPRKVAAPSRRTLDHARVQVVRHPRAHLRHHASNSTGAAFGT